MKEELFIPLVGGVVVALIAGFVSLVVSILTKDQKTSEFRQAWIDSLRNDVAELAGHLQAIIDIALDKIEGGVEDANDVYHGKHSEFIRMEVCIVRIKLRLNPDEHQIILHLLDQLHSDDGGVKETINQLKSLIEEVQPVLKSEWVRVKKGELSYRLLKWLSLTAIVFGGSMAVFYFAPAPLFAIARPILGY